YKCPGEIYPLLTELYVCLQNECPTAAAMVVRAILERTMISAIGDQGSFSANLKKFASDGYVAAKQLQVIEPVLEAGHASIHRAFEPSQEDLVTIVDIMEAILQTVFVHPSQAAALKQRIPQRSP